MSLSEKLKHMFLDETAFNSTKSQHDLSDTSGDSMPYILMGIISVVLIVTMIALFKTSQPPLELGSNACPIDAKYITNRTYVLMDLSNRLTPRQDRDLKSMLKIAATNLKPLEEIQISRTQAVIDTPKRRKKLDSFCSPDLRALSSYGKRVQASNCADILKAGERYNKWHISLSPEQKKRIQNTCELKIAQEKRATNAVRVPAKQGEGRSYIVGAIESIMYDMKKKSKVPTSLIMFSDMLQNSPWFNQYALGPSSWTIDNLLEKRKEQNDTMGPVLDNPFKSVLICFLSRNLTDYRESVHRQMWANYFKNTPNYGFADEGECADKAMHLMKR